MRHGVIIAAMPLAGPAIGLTWQATTGDSTALPRASAFAPGKTTSFDCTAPSPQVVSLIQTGDHETTRSDTPHEMMVRFNVDLIDPFVTPEHLHAVRIVLDGVAHELPLLDHRPGGAMNMRAIGAAVAARGVPTSFAEQAMTEAYVDNDGQSDILLPGQFLNCAQGSENFRPTLGVCNAENQCRSTLFAAAGAAAGAPDWSVAYSATVYDVWTGPGQLSATFIGPVCARFGFDFVCASRFGWTGSGFALLDMQQVAHQQEGEYGIADLVTSNIGYNAVRSGSLPAGYQLALLQPLPDPWPRAILDHLGAQCAGGYDIDVRHVQSADLDGDGIQDFVLNWAGMQCGAADFGAIGCGAGDSPFYETGFSLAQQE